MKNLIIRAISGLVLVWALLEATASENVWYYVVWWGICLGAVIELIGLVHKTQKLKNKTLWTLTGILYIALSGWLLWEMHPHWILLVVMLTMVWANDVGAYITGITLGKHKMMPKISPKKTWEGFFGGLVFAAAVAALWFYLPIMNNPLGPILYGVELWIWMLVGVSVGLAAVTGDMIESILKRKIGVKDSGKIIPGHGGILDRFDATFMAIPIFYILLVLLKII